MSLFRRVDGSDPVLPEPLRRLAGPEEVRRSSATGHLGTGTLACPGCDAPVALGPGPHGPAEPLGCPFCAHTGALRDFLSLAAPARPARVEVRVVLPVPGAAGRR